MADAQLGGAGPDSSSLGTEIAASVVYLNGSGCSPNTACAYQHDLSQVHSFLDEQGWDWRALTPARLARVAGRLGALNERLRCGSEGWRHRLIADLRRRSAIEAEIGHMKTDGRLSRCPLKGPIGDALFAVLCACGHNIRKILAHLRAWLAWIIAALRATPACPNQQRQVFTPA